MVNAHPTLLVAMVDAEGQLREKIPKIREFVQNRESFTQKVIENYTRKGSNRPLKRDMAKKFLISLFYGATLQNRAHKDKTHRKKDHCCVKSGNVEHNENCSFHFENELKEIITEVKTVSDYFFQKGYFKEIQDALKKRLKKEDSKILRRKYIAHVVQGIECKVLLFIDRYLQSKEQEISCLIHDGFLLLMKESDSDSKEDSIELLIQNIEQEIEKEFGSKIKLTTKRFDSHESIRVFAKRKKGRRNEEEDNFEFINKIRSLTPMEREKNKGKIVKFDKEYFSSHRELMDHLIDKKYIQKELENSLNTNKVQQKDTTKNVSRLKRLTKIRSEDDQIEPSPKKKIKKK